MKTLFLLAFGIGWNLADFLQREPINLDLIIFWMFSMLGCSFLEVMDE